MCMLTDCRTGKILHDTDSTISERKLVYLYNLCARHCVSCNCEYCSQVVEYISQFIVYCANCDAEFVSTNEDSQVFYVCDDCAYSV